MKLTSNTVYEHEKYGEVVVIDVHHVFEEYDLDSKDGQLVSRVVRHSEEWDRYGPMPSSVRVTLVEEFRRGLGAPIRTLAFIGPSGEHERS